MVDFWQFFSRGASVLSMLFFVVFSQVQDLTPAVKDWENFSVLLNIRELAPEMQDDIYTLLPYETQRYQVKPNFVFIDQGVKKEGLLNLLVAHMSILHLVYKENNKTVWFGTLYFQTKQGATIYSKEGYELDILPQDTDYQVSFTKDDRKMTLKLPMEEDKTLLLKEGDRSLFAYLFLLPTSLPPD